VPSVLVLAALLAAGIRCEPRGGPDRPPPPMVFTVLGGQVLDAPPRCEPGSVPRAPPESELSPLPARAGGAQAGDGCQAQGCWAWAGWNERRPLRGAGARLEIEVPAVESPDHSLAEVALRWGEDDREILEVGWEVAPRRYGDGQPHLFVGRWVNGSPCEQACPFVASSRRLVPGMSLGRWAGKSLAVGWLIWEGRAWAWVDGEWLGAFELGERSPNVVRVAQWFGEVFFVRDPPTVAMGNGRAAEHSEAARFSSVCDVPDGGEACVVRPIRLPSVTSPGRYDLRVDEPGGFRYGGPGVRPPPPPSSASEGRPPATGRSAPSLPR